MHLRLARLRGPKSGPSISARQRHRSVMQSSAPIRTWHSSEEMWLTPALLQDALQLDSSRRLRQPGVGTPRRRRHLHSLVLSAGASTTDHRDRDIRQHETRAFVTSFAATPRPLSMRGQYRMPSALARRAFQAPEAMTTKDWLHPCDCLQTSASHPPVIS